LSWLNTKPQGQSPAALKAKPQANTPAAGKEFEGLCLYMEPAGGALKTGLAKTDVDFMIYASFRSRIWGGL
jgi:hypothetical protein